MSLIRWICCTRNVDEWTKKTKNPSIHRGDFGLVQKAHYFFSDSEREEREDEGENKSIAIVHHRKPHPNQNGER
jgi:hypothetical protein